MWCATAPSRTASSWISGIWSRFAWVIVVLIWNSIPAAFKCSMPGMAPAKAPGTLRKTSWVSGPAPSRLMLTRWMPTAASRRAMSAVTSVPFVARTMRSPWPSP